MFAISVSLVMRQKVCSSPFLRFRTLCSAKISKEKNYVPISWNVAAADIKIIIQK